MEKEVISVVIPVYNVQAYLGRCVESVMRQTYDRLEIILVDDGSTDNSGRLCDEYAGMDSRIKVIHKENGGLADARNAGIDKATGTMFSFVDSDDYIAEDMLERLYDAKRSSGAQIAACQYQMVSDDHGPSDGAVDSEVKVQELSSLEALRLMLKLGDITCSAWGKLYDRELFSEVRYPKGRNFEDLGTTYKLFAQAGKLVLVFFRGYYYFSRPGSLQNRPYDPSKLDAIQFAQEQKAYLDERFPELESATTGTLVSCCFHVLLSMDETDPAIRGEYERLCGTILKNRRRLIFCGDVSRKVRVGCLLSYFGFPMVKKLFGLIGANGKSFG